MTSKKSKNTKNIGTYGSEKMFKSTVHMSNEQKQQFMKELKQLEKKYSH